MAVLGERGNGGRDVGEVVGGKGATDAAVLELSGGGGAENEVELFEARVDGRLAFAVRIDGQEAEASEGLRHIGLGIAFAKHRRVVASGRRDVGGLFVEGGCVAT